MSCPWLRETRVRFCAVSPSRKLVPVAAGVGPVDGCAANAALGCSLARQYLDEDRAAGPCPFLQEGVAEYCAAAPVKKLIPMTQDLSTRCHGEAHRSCPLAPSDGAGETTLRASLAAERHP